MTKAPDLDDALRQASADLIVIRDRLEAMTVLLAAALHVLADATEAEGKAAKATRRRRRRSRA